MPFAGELFALATAVCWSVTAVFFTEAGKRIGSFRVNQIRLVFAVVIYTIVLLLTTGYLLPDSLTREQVLLLALSGVIGLVIGDGAGFKALVMIGPRLMTLVASTTPIMATIIARFALGERLTWFDYSGIVVTIAGVAWVVTERRQGPVNSIAAEHPDAGSLRLGLGLALIAAFCQAAGLILSKQAMVRSGPPLDPMPASFLRMLPSMVILWGISGVRGQLPETIVAFRLVTAMALTFGGAVFGPFLGVWTSLVAVLLIPAGVAATLNATTPILIIPVVAIVYREHVSARAILGALVAFGGVVLLFLGGSH